MAHLPQTITSSSSEVAGLRSMTSMLDKPKSYTLSEVRVVVVCYDQLGKPAMPAFDMKLSSFGIKHRLFVDDAEYLAEEAGFKGPYHCYTVDQLHELKTDGHTALDKFTALANEFDAVAS